jgi:hypothetical protein
VLAALTRRDGGKQQVAIEKKKEKKLKVKQRDRERHRDGYMFTLSNSDKVAIRARKYPASKRMFTMPLNAFCCISFSAFEVWSSLWPLSSSISAVLFVV